MFNCIKVLLGWDILIKQFLKLIKQLIKLLSGKSAFVICWQSKLFVRRKLLQVRLIVKSIKVLKQFWPIKQVSPKAFGTLLGIITLLIDAMLITINCSPINWRLLYKQVCKSSSFSVSLGTKCLNEIQICSISTVNFINRTCSPPNSKKSNKVFNNKDIW